MEFSIQQAARITGSYLGQQRLARRIKRNAALGAQATQDRVEISPEARRLLSLRLARE